MTLDAIKLFLQVPFRCDTEKWGSAKNADLDTIFDIIIELQGWFMGFDADSIRRGVSKR